MSIPIASVNTHRYQFKKDIKKLLEIIGLPGYIKADEVEDFAPFEFIQADVKVVVDGRIPCLKRLISTSRN